VQEIVSGLRERWSGTKRTEKLPLCATLSSKARFLYFNSFTMSPIPLTRSAARVLERLRSRRQTSVDHEYLACDECHQGARWGAAPSIGMACRYRMLRFSDRATDPIGSLPQRMRWTRWEGRTAASQLAEETD
jgi:hypothetical protein